ncbi:MAG: endonuclease domain-containing protein [Rhodospirillaceae bacterium]|nr:endonuclease domain-containing protein [Rhodospirillaceae bacterium]
MAISATMRARGLRRRQTDAESVFWSRVRNRQLDGAKFKRQVPIGRFVADFACYEARLIVELDGGQHDAQSARDIERTQAIEGLGYRVVRFWNNDVLSNIDGVLDALRAELARSSGSKP